jgi:hypothetical protein
MSDEKKQEQVCPYCPMCGEHDCATVDHWNGGWTQITCPKCGGGVRFLWIRGGEPCTRSITLK